MNISQLKQIIKEVEVELEKENERDQDDYSVFGTWFIDKEDFTRQECIGEVELPENATVEDMPKELEINGFTYKLEE